MWRRSFMMFLGVLSHFGDSFVSWLYLFLDIFAFLLWLKDSYITTDLVWFSRPMFPRSSLHVPFGGLQVPEELFYTETQWDCIDSKRCHDQQKPWWKGSKAVRNLIAWFSEDDAKTNKFTRFHTVQTLATAATGNSTFQDDWCSVEVCSSRERALPIFSTTAREHCPNVTISTPTSRRSQRVWQLPNDSEKCWSEKVEKTDILTRLP